MTASEFAKRHLPLAAYRLTHYLADHDSSIRQLIMTAVLCIDIVLKEG